MGWSYGLRRKIISSGLCFLLLIPFIRSASAQEAAASVDAIIHTLKDYFQAYYSRIANEGFILPQPEVLQNIKTIIGDAYPQISKETLRDIHNLDELSSLLERYLGRYGKAITIFSADGSDVVQCWLGEIAEEEKKSSNVWGNEVRFTARAIDKLSVRDFVYFLSAGREAIDAGVREGVIYHNLEEYRNYAGLLWDFLSGREAAGKNRRYDSSKMNRLRRRLQYEGWYSVYADCVKEGMDKGEARDDFIDKAIAIIKENSLYHEIGHIFADTYLPGIDTARQEKIAFLTELRYGPSPYESLSAVVAAGYKSPIGSYAIAGKKITEGFISFIINEQVNENPEYSKFDMRPAGRLRKMENLCKITENQIRLISEFIYRKD